MGRRIKPLIIPPTRNHRQLAVWINAQELVDLKDRPIVASVTREKNDTGSNIKGTRLRRPGKGRWGLVLEIWLKDRKLKHDCLFEHHAAETYRTHSEARSWAASNLKKPSL